nr:MAG TPA: hypothetical protein [Caudoviricetes sp.]
MRSAIASAHSRLAGASRSSAAPAAAVTRAVGDAAGTVAWRGEHEPPRRKKRATRPVRGIPKKSHRTVPTPTLPPPCGTFSLNCGTPLWSTPMSH